MGCFKDAAELYKCLGALFDTVAKDPDLGPKLASAGMVIRFDYKDPEAQITIDTKNSPTIAGQFFTLYYGHGSTELQPKVLMTMKADVGHSFSLGKVDLVNALTRRQIVAVGPIAKVLKLLPIIKPTYQMYPAILKQIGY